MTVLGAVCKQTALLVALGAIGCYVACQNDTIIERTDAFLTSLQDFEDHLKNHIYLHNNYAPVPDEHRAVPAKVVEGAIPPGLNGVFVRNGPNPIPQHEWHKGYHWFDGHGQLHNVRIKDGEVPLYSNQYIPTPRYTVEKAKGKEYFMRIGEIKGIIGLIKAALLEPQRGKLHDMEPLEKGQANTHTIMSREHKFYAVHEGSLPFEIQLNEDGSIGGAGLGYETFGNVLDYAVSAHPKVDPQSGNFLFHSYSPQPDAVERDGNYKVGEYNLETRQVETYYGIRTDDGHTSFAHDIMFTPNWFVLYDNSAHFDPAAMIQNGTFFTWRPSHTLKIGLAPRHKGTNATTNDVVWFDVGSPHIMIHPLNAWEEDDGTVVLWSPTGDFFDININQGTNFYYMAELRMNPNTPGKVTKTVIDKQWNVEFPRIRLDYLGKFGRFGTATIMEPRLGGDGLFKGFVVYDMLERKTHRTVLYPEGDVGGEAVVIPKPNTSESHEFYVGTMIRNTQANKSYFVLYDGETGELTVRMELPHRVPYGFHCEWITEEQLQGHLQHHHANRMASGSATASE